MNAQMLTALVKAIAPEIRSFVNDQMDEVSKRLNTLERERAKTFADYYEGAWMAGTHYERGQITTRSGCTWLCMIPGNDKPGESDSWKLIAEGDNR